MTLFHIYNQEDNLNEEGNFGGNKQPEGEGEDTIGVDQGEGMDNRGGNKEGDFNQVGIFGGNNQLEGEGAMGGSLAGGDMGNFGGNKELEEGEGVKMGGNLGKDIFTGFKLRSEEETDYKTDIFS